MTVLDEPLLDEDEASRELGVKSQTMSAWRYRGVGPRYIKVGKLVKYTPSFLREYIQSGIVRPGAAVALLIIVHGWFFGGAS